MMEGRRREGALFSFWGKGRRDSGTNGNAEEATASTSGSGSECTQYLDDDPFGNDDDDILAQVCDDDMEGIQVGEPKDLSFSNILNKAREEHLPPVPHSTPLESLPGFDVDAGQSWIYPINYPLREYQYSIVEKALYKNTLVSLPTGLGKTFIAAVLMYNFYRWYPRGKIVFMAPTKPLVAQQIEACFNIVGIPQEDTSQLTGTMAPERRVQAWAQKRVFFLTPQVLTNDLSRGVCPGKLIKCLVLDEAHRALGNHAYCQVVRGLREYCVDFRILALSATPGSDLKGVQQVITNLMISHIELRSEESADIKPYLHHRSIEKVVVPLGEELTRLKTKYLNVLRVYVNKLLDMKVLFTRDETTLSKFQILQARDAFRQNPPGSLPAQRYGVVEGLFALCMTLYHSYELMLQHGTRSFYRFLKDTLQGDKGYSFARSELHRNEVFQDLLEELAKKFEPKSSVSQPSKHHSSQMFSEIGPAHSAREKCDLPFVISHPKIAKLLSIVVDHHQKFAENGTSTRIMIFSQYRESVMEITELLQSQSPLVKAMSFIGQSSAGRGGRGFSQKEQLKVVKEFREGGFNTLISTCVGEEGLDIGEVDLIICYDAPKSPIRLVQRMGRTGRKREGRIVVLVTKGKEEQMYNHSQYQKKSINAALANKEKLSRFLNPHSPLMIPKGVTPVCMKLHMKVGTWKARMGKGRTSTTDSVASVSSLLYDSSSSLTNGKRNHVKKVDLSKEEWEWWSKNLQVPTAEIKTVPQPSLTCLGTHDPEDDSTSVSNINLGNYQPWQTMTQTTHVMGHSTRTLHLVQLTEFIGLQCHFDPDDDPYGLEMATFLDMAYVKGSNDNRPSWFTSGRSEEPRGSQQMSMSQRNANTSRGRKNSCASKGKKKKAVQSSLITSMLIQKPLVQAEKEKPKKDLVDFNVGDAKRTGDGSDSEDSDVCVIEDDNVTSNVEGNTDDQVVATEDVISDRSTKRESGNEQDLRTNDSPPEGKSQIYSRMREFLTSLPPVRQPPLHVLTPPSEADVLETMEPVSPSDVLSAYDDWMEEKERDVGRKSRESRGDALNEARDVDVSASIHTETEDDDFPDLTELCAVEGKNGKSSEAPATPVPGNRVTTVAHGAGKDEAFGKASENVTPPKVPDSASASSDADVSPVFDSTLRKPIRTNLPLHSSTPKVNARCLFRVDAPDTMAIERISPIPREGLNSPERGKSSSRLALSQRGKVRSKLSKFAILGRLQFREEGEAPSARKADAKALHAEADIVERNGGKMTEKLAAQENGGDVPRDEKGRRATKSTKSSGKDGDLTELSAREDTVGGTNGEIDSTQNDWENSVRVRPPERGRDEARNVVNGAFKDSDVSPSEGFSITNTIEGAPECDEKGGSASREGPIDAGSRPSVNFDLSFDDHLFAELEVEEPRRAGFATPIRPPSSNKRSSSLLGVTQLLELMDETTVDWSSCCETPRSPPRSKPDERGCHGRDESLPDEMPVNETKQRKSLEASPEMTKRVKESATPNFSLLDDLVSEEEDEREVQQSGAECSVHFDLLGTDEFEPMSESLLANVEVDAQTEACPRGQRSGREEKSTDVSGYVLNDDPSFVGSKIHSPVTLRRDGESRTGTRDVMGINAAARREADGLSTSSNAQAWPRKRKGCNVVESEIELSSDSENVVGSAKSTRRKKSRSRDAMDRKKLNLGATICLDDDDFQDDSAVTYQDMKDELESKKLKRYKKKRNEFVEEEAEVSEDCNSLSSDESDAKAEEYDRSFVDDCTQGTQDDAVDMKAVYLQSVVSPLKKGQHYRPHLSDTPESIEEFDEEDEDSFVVDNDFVEYNSEYLGDSMLAEDSIMIQALHDVARTKKAKDTKKGKTGKRKRIILYDSPSDEEIAAEKNINECEGKSCVQSDIARELSPRASNSSVLKTMRPDNVRLKDHQSIKLTEGVIPRLSAGSSQLEVSECPEFEMSLHDKASTKKAKDTQNGNKFRRKNINLHDLSSDEDSVAESKSMKSNSVLLKPNETGKSDTQSNKKPSGFETLQCKDHQSINLRKEDTSVLSKTSQSGQVTTVVLVDSLEIAGGGNIVSKLRNQYGAHTSVVQLAHAQYTVSTRMAVTRLLHSVFSSSQQRAKLVQQVQGMLNLYDRPVIIVEMDRTKMGESPSTRKHRSRYLDTITCACTHVTQLKVLYSSSQEETTCLLWQLVEQEKSKGYSIPVLPERIAQLKQVVNFYRSLPRISYASAVYLAHQFSTVTEFVNSSVEVMQEKGRISVHRATAIKEYLCRNFRADMLPS